MELNLTNILSIIITIAILIVAIKITFTFDINKYLESRKKDLENKIKNYCPHAYVISVEGGVKVQSAFISPSGTTNYICERCQLVTYHIDEMTERQRVQSFAKDLKEYNKQEKKFQKLLRKAGYI